jgi:hypothetical protein
MRRFSYDSVLLIHTLIGNTKSSYIGRATQRCGDPAAMGVPDGHIIDFLPILFDNILTKAFEEDIAAVMNECYALYSESMNNARGINVPKDCSPGVPIPPTLQRGSYGKAIPCTWSPTVSHDTSAPPK